MPMTLKPMARDDYLVMLDGDMIGSIHKVFRPVPAPWRWYVDSRYTDEEIAGWAVDLEAAKAAFREAWEAIVEP